MTNYFIVNHLEVLSILISTFTAIFIFILNKKLSIKGKFTHREQVIKKVNEILTKRGNPSSIKVELINVKNYFNFYPQNKKNHNGYTYIGAHIKGPSYLGVEFIDSNVGAEGCGSNSFVLNKNGDITLLKAGFIPYEWIEYIDMTGDDTTLSPQIYCRFKGKDKEPYKSFSYYLYDYSYEKKKDNPDSSPFKKVEILNSTEKIFN